MPPLLGAECRPSVETSSEIFSQVVDEREAESFGCHFQCKVPHVSAVYAHEIGVVVRKVRDLRTQAAWPLDIKRGSRRRHSKEHHHGHLNLFLR